MPRHFGPELGTNEKRPETVVSERLCVVAGARYDGSESLDGAAFIRLQLVA